MHTSLIFLQLQRLTVKCHYRQVKTSAAMTIERPLLTHERKERVLTLLEVVVGGKARASKEHALI